MAPIATGQRLYDRLVPMMQELDSVVTEAVGAAGRAAGTLRVNTPGYTAGAIYRWEFEKDGKAFEMSVDGPLTSNMQEVAEEGALQDLGVLYT